VSGDGEAQRGVVLSGLAAVLVEDDVQGQVQVILDAPMGSSGVEDHVWIRLDRGNEEPRLEALLAGFLVDTPSVIASSERKPFHLG